MNIYGNFVILRAIEREDLEILHRAINDPFLEKMEESFNFPISLTQQEKWLENVLQNRSDMRLMVEYQGAAVGWISLTNIDWKNRCAHQGIKIFSEEYRNRGIATDAINALCQFAFHELGLNRLETSILSYNTPSLHLYCKKLNWQQEGVRKKAVYKNGHFHNVILLAILQEDFNYEYAAE